ncbi:Snf7 family [Aspergillus sp. HF37]|nr:Snf7 family [Aspergillus sp. HF37]
MNDLLNYILTREDAFRKNRLPSLYSDFSLQKRTNPDGYDVNVSAWEKALTRAARHGYLSPSHAAADGLGPRAKDKHAPTRTKGNHLLLKADESLLRDLEIPELGVPVGLGAVFDEAIQKRTMVPLQLYKTNAISLQKSQWGLIDPGVLSPWRVMSWGVQELVLVENLRESADRVVKQAVGTGSSKMDLVYSKEGFIHDFATVLNEHSELSAADFDVLLLYLSRDCGAIAYDGRTVKFRPADGTSPEITQQDTTIASIRTLMSTISRQVEALEEKTTSLAYTAKAALNNKNRISALSAVRSKKLVEHNLKQRLDTLAQLEQVYSKIEQAADQVEYVKVMETSTGVLRGLNTQVGGAEKVEDVVDDLREEMSKADEVGQVINETGPVIDEGEIDEEIEGLEAKEQEKREETEAEETRKKLADLDSLKQPTGTARTAEPEQNVEAALAESIGRLSRMSVEDDANAAARSADKEKPLSAK